MSTATIPGDSFLESARIDPAQAALLIVDVQEKLSAVMPAATMAACERNIHVLVELAKRLRWPILWSEQYPKGLGPTLPALHTALADLQTSDPSAVTRIEKMTFACTDDDVFLSAHARLQKQHYVVTGMEAHICVWQTVRGLRALGSNVFLPRDAVISRTSENHHVGLELARAAGAVVTSTETVAFDALRRAGTDDFRAISRLIK
ncbi:MAG TPA: isochorismatase family protein [Polyangia bacterium]